MPPGDAGTLEEAVRWVREGAIPLTTSDPGQGFDDLRRLAPSIGPARIVAMGEATHGTREFFRLKHRVFEYLVEEHGFRLFGLEASYAGCLPLDYYIQTGEGDLRALIKGQGFWTWDTEEVLELVEWMRVYNSRRDAPEDRLHLYGFDTQDAATPLGLALGALRSFEAEEAERLGRELAPATASRYPGVLGDGSLEAFEAVVRAIDELQERLAKHQEALEKTRFGYARLRLAAEAGRYAVRASRPTEEEPQGGALTNVRDETMAEVVRWILEHHGEGSRIMLWAHDGHVTKYRGDPAKRRPMLGSFLEDRFGDDYLPVGFSFAEGEFQALYWPKSGEDWARRVLGVYRIERSIPGSIDDLLSRVGAPLFVLDLRAGGDGEVPAWLHQPRKHRSIGGLFDQDDIDGLRFVDEIVLAEHFELMAFVHTTSRAVPLSPPPTFVLGAWTEDSGSAPGGARVTGVAGDSIAERAGLRAGDVIVELAGSPIASAHDFSVALSQLNRPGSVEVRILRQGDGGEREAQTLEVGVPAWVAEDSPRL
ncbi:MAG: erythromycin esterase family protein [Acidobacteriota bacterium]